MTRRTDFAIGEFYHIYNRGTDKRNIFLDQRDYNRFLALLYCCNSTDNVVLRLEEQPFLKQRKETLVDVGCYCLMPNHFHVLLREKCEKGISRFMQKLSTGYTMYFNKRRERNGVLFQGKFKAAHVEEDRYLRYLISYIHLNPVKIIEPRWKENGISGRGKAEKYLNSYAHSSYMDYLDFQRPENVIVSKNIMPEYFNSTFGFKRLVTEWLDTRSDLV